MKISTGLIIGCQLIGAAVEAAEEVEMLPPGLAERQAEFQQLKRNLRRLQLGEFADDDPYINPNGLMERKPCVEFERLSAGQLEDPWGAGDETCLTNSCGGGCCRAYNWLLCDEDNALAYVPCGKC